MTIAITGATGFVGRNVLAEARRLGLAVRALTRREQPDPQGVAWVRGDLADEASLARLVEGASAVLHIAALVTTNDPSRFTAANVDGSRLLIEAARRAGTARFILVSSLAAREPDLSAYGRSKRDAEVLLEASGLDWIIVRPPAVYGPGDSQMLDMFRAANLGFMPLPPQGRLSVIHVADLARLLLALATHEATHEESFQSRTFEPDDGCEGGWSHTVFARAIGAAVGGRVWTQPLPRPLLAAAGRLDPILRGGKARLNPDRARYIAHPDWVCRPNARPPTTLWTPEVKTRDGLIETARWYGLKGWL